MKTRGGSRKRGSRIASAWSAATLVLFLLTNTAVADATSAFSVSEPANAPAETPLAPVTPAAAAPIANPAAAPIANPVAAPATASVPAASSTVTAATPPKPATVPSAPPASNAPTESVSPAPSSGAPRTLALPAGTVAVPPLTGQSSTLDPNSPSAAGFNSNADIINYERYQNPDSYPQQQIPLQSFINEQDNSSQLGVELREDHRKLKSGEDATGLLVIGVTPGSPAAKAGLHAYSQTARNVLEGVAVAGALVFPPAVLLAPIIASVPIQESYDLIIAVDGWRVMDFTEFEDHLHDLQPGEIVYLSVIRDGERKQIQVQIPQNMVMFSPGY